jgi:hypothetical protein
VCVSSKQGTESVCLGVCVCAQSVHQREELKTKQKQHQQNKEI